MIQGRKDGDRAAEGIPGGANGFFNQGKIKAQQKTGAKKRSPARTMSV
jgi:hypothetical protein